MDLIILKKKIDGFRSGNGQLQNVPPELLLELRQSWENFRGPAEEFRRELGMKIGTLRKLLIDSKKLNHVLASSEAVDLSEMVEQPPGSAEKSVNTLKALELVYDGGSKVIRFPDIEMLLEFLKRAS